MGQPDDMSTFMSAVIDKPVRARDPSPVAPRSAGFRAHHRRHCTGQVRAAEHPHCRRRLRCQVPCRPHAPTALTSRSRGFFVEPTVIQVQNPQAGLSSCSGMVMLVQAPLMATEIFGPVLGVFVYPDRSVRRGAAMRSRCAASGCRRWRWSTTRRRTRSPGLSSLATGAGSADSSACRCAPVSPSARPWPSFRMQPATFTCAWMSQTGR